VTSLTGELRAFVERCIAYASNGTLTEMPHAELERLDAICERIYRAGQDDARARFKRDGALLRMAGNIACGMVSATDEDGAPLSGIDAIAGAAVALAEAIVAEVERRKATW